MVAMTHAPAVLDAVDLRSNVARRFNPQKGLDFGCEQSGSVRNFGRLDALRDPAPPASSLWWGFGGAA
jgi:hypothetical protein